MFMELSISGCALRTARPLLLCLENVLSTHSYEGLPISLYCVDPHYSPISQGFMPVEIWINAYQEIERVVALALSGEAPFEELVIRWELDFQRRVFRDDDGNRSLAAGADCFAEWQQVFCTAVARGAYEFEVKQGERQ